MLFGDFEVFWKAAQALLAGGDPYAVFGVYYPLPVFFLFIPFALLPLPLAQWLWLGLQVLILVAVFGRRIPYLVWFMPTLLNLVSGNMVTVWLAFYALLRGGRHAGVALAALMLKPQLVPALAPWLLWNWVRLDRRQLWRFLLTLGAVLSIGFAVQPDWIARWLAVSGQRLRAPIAPSIWGLVSFLPFPVWVGLAGLISVVVVLWAWRRSRFDELAAAGMLVNPVIISYDLVLLTLPVHKPRGLLLVIAAGLAAFLLSALWLNEAPFLLVTLATLLATRVERGIRISAYKDPLRIEKQEKDLEEKLTAREGDAHFGR